MSNANEPAFPVTQTKHNKASHAPDYFNVHSVGGLTKRELLAAVAMQGMLASETEASNYGHIGFLAESAVKRADALLAALAKK